MDAKKFLGLGEIRKDAVVYHRDLGLAGVVRRIEGRQVRVAVLGEKRIETLWPRVRLMVLPQSIQTERTRLVGLAPAHADPYAPPLCGDSGARLARACGLSDWTLLGEVFALRNAADRPKWRTPELRRGAHRALSGAQTAVVLGREVARVLDLGDLDWFEWATIDVPGTEGIRLTVVPHPSGRSRLWNDPHQRAGTSGRLRAIARRSVGCPAKVDLSSWVRATNALRVVQAANDHLRDAFRRAERAAEEVQWAARGLGMSR